VETLSTIAKPKGAADAPRDPPNPPPVRLRVDKPAIQ